MIYRDWTGVFSDTIGFIDTAHVATSVMLMGVSVGTICGANDDLTLRRHQLFPHMTARKLDVFK